jgi:hypothetical protein
MRRGHKGQLVALALVCAAIVVIAGSAARLRLEGAASSVNLALSEVAHHDGGVTSADALAAAERYAGFPPGARVTVRQGSGEWLVELRGFTVPSFGGEPYSHRKPRPFHWAIIHVGMSTGQAFEAEWGR